jgi:hypothetical protein
MVGGGEVMKGWWIANSYRKDEEKTRRVYDADEVDKEIAAKNEELAGMDIKIRFLSKDLAALKDALRKAREYVLDGLRGALAPMREGQLDYDEILRVIDQALGLEEE